MLKTARVADTAASNRLIKLWTARYLPDLSVLPAQRGEFPTADLVETASKAGRNRTVEKVHRALQLSCARAGLETHALMSYIPNIINLTDARQISQSVEQVYEKTLQIYAQQQSPSYYLRFIDTSSTLFTKLALPALMLPALQILAAELEPMLLQLQDRHLCAADSRTIGFITTSFHLSTKQLLTRLTLCEQVLLTPYLKFVEEQVCIPWQRLCAAAATYAPNSPTVVLIEKLLDMSHLISQSVYSRALQAYPNHQSRRGGLKNKDVAASTLRDLHMFQGYLWLCVLERNMGAIEQELLPLCIAVFPSVGVRWELVEMMLQALEAEIHARVDQEQSDSLRSYTRSLRKIFAMAQANV
ncbi:hypothetical protein IFO70_13815 [Phormidium tenue FACHB-886]|nr:hypothetical protein [Phormidium tenue FACHB-886]